MSAIKATGNNDGMRIQLDIPESEMGEAVHLLLMRQKVLKVTIEVDETNGINGKSEQPTTTVKRTTAKQRKR
jgi:hypothetical protein